jgi:hypothetical protein
LKDFEEEG